jgi:siroheme synthase
MAYRISTSRVPHGRGGETFETVADAQLAIDTLPGLTLADIVAVRTGASWEDQAAANQLTDARRAAAEQVKAAEDAQRAQEQADAKAHNREAEEAARVVALAEAIAAREPQALH